MAYYRSLSDRIARLRLDSNRGPISRTASNREWWGSTEPRQCTPEQEFVKNNDKSFRNTFVLG
jgi:hypothetical protein